MSVCVYRTFSSPANEEQQQISMVEQLHEPQVAETTARFQRADVRLGVVQCCTHVPITNPSAQS